MLTIFEFTSYREYLTVWIESQGARAYGLKGKIAEALGISSSLVSQIFKGEKTLTPDQTSDLADYMTLNEIEADYLHLLVESDRAGSPRYQEKLRRKIKHLQEQARKVNKRLPRHQVLSDEHKAIYYSSWLYAGVRNLTAITGRGNVNAIAEHLRLEPSTISRVLRFLLENGMCQESAGQITYGPANLHVDRDSPFVNKHHQNWRFQALQKVESKKENDFFFTSPMSLSRQAAEEIRKLLPTFIQNVTKLAAPSESEIGACLNLDWFEY